MSAITTDEISESFAPLIGDSAHTLILGTMPGRQSLDDQQYYAHKRNALWPILIALATGQTPDYVMQQVLSYATRCQIATDAGFALWDVLASCQRRGSLDSSIVRHSEVPNNIDRLLSEHRNIETIICNGRTAYTLFVRHTLRTIKPPIPRIITLPSTSPAMATLSIDEKYARWSEAVA